MIHAPHLRLLRPESTPPVISTRVIDTHATNDARVDHQCGDEHLYDLMEQLFAGGDISQATWERYALIYERERLSLEGDHDTTAATRH
jgi:hypothetical protein